MPNRPSIADAIVALVLLAGFLAFASEGPPRPLPTTAPDSAFSAERAMADVRAIAERPHPPATADHERVKDYVVSRLRAAGLDPQIQRTTAIGPRFPQAGRVENVIARLPGRTPGGRAVMLVAHYDGVGAAPAAGDDASGSAVLLECLRALKAGAPLDHDVIFLFTDQEEAGLLGAAAFVAEHPWAKDVALTLNFEARGTGGIATMFQTGPDNLDQLRILRRQRNAAASSVAVTVYQLLPNDTDLSELFQLGQPALNFAFADGVERYHTSEDDVAHLDPGSIQQEGEAALGVVRAVGRGALPRPATGNAIFFNLPVVGLVVYPEAWARPLAIVAVILVILALVAVVRHERRWLLGPVLGILAMAVTAAAAGALAWRLGRSLPAGIDAPGVRGAYAMGLLAVGVGLAMAAWAVVRRWTSGTATGIGPLLVWTGLAVAASWKLPGVSFFLVWPVIAAALLALTTGRRPPRAAAIVLRWLPTVTVGVLVVPLAYAMALVVLGMSGPGGIAVAALTPLAAWLLLPALERVAAEHPWRRAAVVLVAGVALVGGGWLAGGRTSFPTRSMVAYAQDADSAGAWLFAPTDFARPGSWNRSALGPDAAPVVPLDSGGTAPAWLAGFAGGRLAMTAAPAPRVALEPPVVAVVSDSAAAGRRRVRLTIRAAHGTTRISLGLSGSPVLASWIDGRAVDTTRYRYHPSSWQMSYWAPPSDSGFTLELELPAGASPALDVAAQSPGLPALPGVAIPPRPADVLPSQSGDVTIVHRRVHLAVGAG